MKPNDLLSTAGETIAYAEDYIETRIELAKLSIAEKGSKSAADLIAIGVVAILGLLAFSFFSVALALVIGSYLDNFALGFTIVGLFFSFLAGVLYVTRRTVLVRPILKQLINKLFNPKSHGNR